ncbi:MAG: N-acetylmuramoyl-L-alanine amidase [Ruminococcus sp.]|nr:N-acetylmuramoyl-L-alanine amidase [Candidatus Apopatosoma intestinale]
MGSKKAVFVTVKFFVFSAVLVCSALAVGNLVARQTNGTLFPVFSSQEGKEPEPVRTIVVDAGHGGMDGGAVSDDGVLEKDLNLAVAGKLVSLLRMGGVRVVMTRSDDRLLADPSSAHKKRDDLASRVRIAEEQENAVFVSIHMNKFPVEKYRGLQVWYSRGNKQSAELADAVQKKTAAVLQPQNTRETKAADSSIYVLDHLDIPAILVECGFLSNAEETRLLCDESYQNKLAAVLYAAIIDYWK